MSSAGWSLLLETEARSGAENMARDEALLDAARTESATVLRLYQWAPPCISFGRNEPALRRYDREAIRQRGWDVVRRPTGGRAVFHDREVTYAVAAPIELWGSLKASYFAIHRVLAEGLRLLGLSASLVERDGNTSLAAGPCFASAAGGEVTVNGRKVIGSAQYREGGAFIQHGSILLDGGQDVLETVTRTGRPTTSTTLSHELGRAVPFDEVAAAITEAARREWGPPRTPSIEIESQALEHYRSDAWTWRR